MENIDEYVFGYTLVNDWSGRFFLLIDVARDVQRWEQNPLGPFLGKSFATSVSPWIITPDALAVAATGQVSREHENLSYLKPITDKPMFDINLSVSIRGISCVSADTDKSGKKVTLAQSNFKYLYFSFQQMLVSQTSNGCNIQCGELIASGTISGPVTNLSMLISG
jgi:fumarylacetoacetase